MYISKFIKLRLKSIFSSHCRKSSSKSSAEYCLHTVKNYDYENFICTILLKTIPRSCALAIRSFNVEIARVAEQASQENIALMRLQFWEETVEKCLSRDFKLVPKHPAATELFKANAQNKFTKRYLNNLISCRKDYIKLTSFNSLEDMEKYAEQSVSNVFYLVLEGCGVKNVNADHAASHLGKSQGLVQQIRSIPHARRLNFIPVPQSLLIKHNVSQEEVIRAISSENLKECTFEIATKAHQHLVKARSLMESVPIEGRAALLPAVPVSIYLDRLQKINYDVFHPSLQHRSWRMLPQLWMTNFQNKY